MALSVLNHFYWDIPEARIPFVIADVVVIVALHYAEKGIRSEKDLAELKAEKELERGKEVEKDIKKAQKLAQKSQAKENMKAQKHTGGSKPPKKIQQPNKKNS